MPYDFSLNDQQRLLQQQAAKTVQETIPFSVARDATDNGLEHVRPYWKQLGELGWTSLAASEAAGGVGFGAVELVLVAYELGRRAAPLPFVAHNAVMRQLSEVGYAIPESLLDGRDVATVAIAPLRGGGTADAGLLVAREDDRVHLTGTKHFVPYATLASHVLVAGWFQNGDHEGESVTVLVPADALSLKTYPSTARDRRAVIDIDATLPASAIVAIGDRALERLSAFYKLGTAGYMCGAARQAQDMAVEYAKTRVIFGRPLGTFQAIAHRGADMLYDSEAQYWLTMEAAWRLDAGLPDDGALAAACAYLYNSTQRISAHAHQIHGAIGFTFEHDLGLLTTANKALIHDLGRVDQSLEQVAATLGLYSLADED